ncbi:ABC transporter family substrate-binding protein [Brevibacterium sp. 91QC2O2]|uniref:ABC transporter family substrate-binding protein n=1 Tax=Brevibacterium sp. 91QC2O2 TaxID=2968458 RepID=UPI00211CFCA2|nr:ABC transporter family substrate-binding protein [Brevibacterium sp. 91QC2O2]MCQ9368745.1 ABC transporter family substrate-binding protein [Brevibacterium sp. 91QC2O2]
MKHIKLALASVATLALATTTACSSGGGSGTTPENQVTGDINTVNSDDNLTGGDISFAIEKTIPNWNTISAAGDISETVWVTNSIYPSAFTQQPNGSDVAMNSDLLDSAKTIKDKPTVVEYKINKNAVWSDETPISADDFIWQYHVLNKKDCKECSTADSYGMEKVKSIKGSDNGKTVTVEYNAGYSDWKAGFPRLLPAHIAKEHGSYKEAFDWFNKNQPTFSGGPFIIDDFKKDVSVKLAPNPKWWGKKPTLQSVTFKMITDAKQIPTALQNGEIDASYPQPQVDLLTQIQGMAGANIDYQMNKSLVMEALMFNHSNSFLSQKPLRQAIMKTLDIQQIIDKGVGQFDSSVEPLGNSMIMSQQDGYENHLEELGFGKGDVEGAKKILTDAGYKIDGDKLVDAAGKTVPPLRLVYTVNNPVRESTANIVAAAAKQIGVQMKIETTDSLGDSTSENKPYGYDIIVVGYTGQPFLASNATKRYTTDTGYNLHYSNKKVDDLVDKAGQSSKPEDVIKFINEADKLMQDDVYVAPLYQKPSLLAYNKKVGNIRDNPTVNGPTYNMAEWGLRSEG